MKHMIRTGTIALSFISLFLCVSPYCQTSNLSKTWIADRGDGTFRNPILHADYSDPDVIRVHDDHYMTSS
ncbi:MAG TPA: hypothetical protein VK907_03490, partial [Phnomibacter sp.]|nr:hypothetical protein [Phnomibacter sp.]